MNRISTISKYRQEDTQQNEKYLVRVMWNVLYPAMKEASLVSDCLPDPPTPTKRTLPPGCRRIREI